MEKVGYWHPCNKKSMRLLLLFLLLTSTVLHAQTKPVAKYLLHVKGECPAWANTYTLSNKKHLVFLTSNQVCILPDTGLYYLSLPLAASYVHIVHISSFELIKDTIMGSTVQVSHMVSEPPVSHYYCCDRLCQGDVIDYYPNGNILLRGKFEGGQPIDSLIEYYPDGVQQRVSVFYKKGWSSIEFDSSGTKASHYKHFGRRGNARGSYSYYYANGSRKEFKRYTKHRMLVSRQYYENGTIKQIERKRKKWLYHDNGQLAESYRKYNIYFFENFCWNRLAFWKRSWERYCNNRTDYGFRYKRYTQTGEKELKATFEVWSVDFDYFPTSLDSGIREGIINKRWFFDGAGKLNRKETFDKNYNKTIIEKKDHKWVKTKVKN